LPRRLEFGKPFERIIKAGQDEQREQRCQDKTADYDSRHAALNIATYARCNRRRHHPDGGDRSGHQHRPQPFQCADDHRIAQGRAGLADTIEVRHHDNSILNRNSEERDESNRGGDVQSLARDE